MTTRSKDRTVDAFEVDGELQGYWLAFLRIVTGWWLFHAGVTKLIENGLSFAYGPAYLRQMTGTALGPIPVWMGENLGPLIEAGVPLGETAIGLGLMVGAFVRLAAFFGGTFMVLFWVGNANFANGVVTAELLGLLAFATTIVFAAGRHHGLDAVLERTAFVQNRPRLRYLLG